jgi:hypothetical protein
LNTNHLLSFEEKKMTDPRNIAHDKRVMKEKKHHGVDLKAATQHAPQPGKKPHADFIHDGQGRGPDSDEPIDKTESGVEP